MPFGAAGNRQWDDQRFFFFFCNKQLHVPAGNRDEMMEMMYQCIQELSLNMCEFANCLF